LTSPPLVAAAIAARQRRCHTANALHLIGLLALSAAIGLVSDSHTNFLLDHVVAAMYAALRLRPC
jgi:hypothetical protein